MRGPLLNRAGFASGLAPVQIGVRSIAFPFIRPSHLDDRGPLAPPCRHQSSNEPTPNPTHRRRRRSRPARVPIRLVFRRRPHIRGLASRPNGRSRRPTASPRARPPHATRSTCTATILASRTLRTTAAPRRSKSRQSIRTRIIRRPRWTATSRSSGSRAHRAARRKSRRSSSIRAPPRRRASPRPSPAGATPTAPPVFRRQTGCR